MDRTRTGGIWFVASWLFLTRFIRMGILVYIPSRLIACGRTGGEPVGDGLLDGGCDMVSASLGGGGRECNGC